VARRILLVEDDPAVRHTVSRILGEAYEVDAVANGEEAIAHVARARPDVVLTDIRMPGMDGVELLSTLRARAPTSTCS
jgi:CheY-like chemotaxis protein